MSLPSKAPHPSPLSPEYPQVASWLEISRSALEGNIEFFRGLLRESGTNTKLAVVLKGNAYGHGLLEVLSVVHGRVDAICVVTPQEALAIRAFEQEQALDPQRIIVLGGVGLSEAVALGNAEVEIALGDAGWEQLVPELRKRRLKQALKVHVFVDSGLGREGFVAERIASDLDFLPAARDVLEVNGVLTHFANAEDPEQSAYPKAQLERFQQAIEQLEALLCLAPNSLERHSAASAATLGYPGARLDLVRIGISLYGFWPAAQTRAAFLEAAQTTPSALGSPALGSVHPTPGSASSNSGPVSPSSESASPSPGSASPALKPVLSWRSVAQVVKTLPAGSYVGYGCTHRCTRDTKIAVLPVGYYEGYPRLLSGKAHVLVNGVRAPLLGRVMMNHIVVDISDALPGDAGTGGGSGESGISGLSKVTGRAGSPGIAGRSGVEGRSGVSESLDDAESSGSSGFPPSSGEANKPVVATLLGRDGDEQISAELLAEWAQTIHYEIVTRIGAHIRRVVVP